MAINLNLPAQSVVIGAANYVPLLANLQANIIKPHGRDYARHVFVRFSAPPTAVKSWLATNVVPNVTSAKEHYRQVEERRTSGADGGTISNFFISASGYAHLGLPVADFASEVFREGMKDRNDSLIDRIIGAANKDSKPETWEAAFRDDVHALVTFADDTEATAEAAAAALAASLAGVGTVLVIEHGQVLRRIVAGGGAAGEPVEHFGYLDGLSNPRFTKDDFETKDGTGTKWDVGAELARVLVNDPFTDIEDAFGSYLVYRKLAQQVDVFDARVVALASTINAGPDLAGAMVVGRFKDGTAVVGSKVDGQVWTNDFNFDDDDDGLRCPLHSHVRKVNPRGTTPFASLKNERKRRITRRGIPYGPPVSGIAEPKFTPNDDPNVPRGLLFMCFQSDIEDQFEFIQRTWVDNEEFPKGLLPFQKDTGDDPLIGQLRDSAQRWPKKWGEKSAGKKSVGFESAVTLKGGEYFFAPSLAFLRAL